MTTPNGQHPEFLTAEEFADWVGKKRPTIYRWHKKGRGPRAIRPGGPGTQLMFERAEVERWIEEQYDNEQGNG